MIRVPPRAPEMRRTSPPSCLGAAPSSPSWGRSIASGAGGRPYHHTWSAEAGQPGWSPLRGTDWLSHSQSVPRSPQRPSCAWCRHHGAQPAAPRQPVTGGQRHRQRGCRHPMRHSRLHHRRNGARGSAAIVTAFGAGRRQKAGGCGRRPGLVPQEAMTWRSSGSPSRQGHIMLFARSVGDPNPVYSDAEYARGDRGRPHHRPADLRPGQRPVRPRLPPAPEARRAVVRLGRRADRRARRPRRRGRRGLHAEQHFEYHRPLRAGDVLTATTCRARRGRSRAGAAASWSSANRSPSTATRTANWS